MLKQGQVCKRAMKHACFHVAPGESFLTLHKLSELRADQRFPRNGHSRLGIKIEISEKGAAVIYICAVATASELKTEQLSEVKSVTSSKMNSIAKT